MSNEGNSDVKTLIFAYMSLVDFILPILVLLGLFWSISKLDFFKNGPFSTRSLQLAFFLRVVMGFGLFLIYSYHYPSRQDADTFKYFDDSKYMYDAFWTNPGDYFKMLFGINCNTEYFNTEYFNNMSNWVRSYDNGLFNDNRLMIRINAFLRIFSLGNYHVHSIILAFLAFMGSFSLSKLFFEVSRSKVLTYVAVFLVPSLIFWSSGILKEAVLLAALGFFAYHFYQLFGTDKTWKNYVMLFLMSCVLIVMKLYVFLAFIPAILTWYLVSKWKRNIFVYCGVYFVFIFLATAIGEFNPKFDFINLIVDKQKQFLFLAKNTNVNSAFEMEVLDYNLWSLFISSPEAVLNVFTKPWPSEMNSVLFIPAFIENIFLLFILIFSILNKKLLNIKERDFVIFCLSFCIILYTVIGLTTPITGAIVRYKIPAIPFLMMAVFMLIDFDKIPNRFTQNKFSRWINTFL